jgi:hypothetical protein
MNKLFLSGLSISLLFVSSSWAQTPERYVVSAKAGMVNFVSGQASLSRAGGAQAALLRQDTIETGDEASTGQDAYAEVLLDPGSYLRLAPNSRFKFASTSLEDTSVDLLAGSVIFEINADNAFALSVTTPTATLRFDHSGIYRVDLDPAPGKLEVIKGQALVGNTEVKAGKLLAFEAGATPEKFDAKGMDAFAMWSDSRAKELARVTNAVAADALNRSLMYSYNSSSWDFFPNRSGLWVWDGFYGSGFYLPFGYGGRTHWSCGYYHPNFNWNHYGWADHWHHPRFQNSGSGDHNGTVAGGNPGSTNHSHDRDHQHDTKGTSGTRVTKPPTVGTGGTQEWRGSGHSHGAGSGSDSGSHHGGGDGAHSSGGTHNSGGSTGSHNSGGSTGSHNSGGSGSSHGSDGSGGSHSSGGSSSSGSKSSGGSSGSKTTPIKQ